jgi:hypothetical protein
MLKKITFTLTLLLLVCVLPSYTNTCAKPNAAFMKAENLPSTCTSAAPARIKAVRADLGLEVFPLELISVQL